jgi:hypothetical protein
MKNFVFANEPVLHYRRSCAVPSSANWQLQVGPKLSWVGYKYGQMVGEGSGKSNSHWADGCDKEISKF